jgi:hypothetical protein
MRLARNRLPPQSSSSSSSFSIFGVSLDAFPQDFGVRSGTRSATGPTSLNLHDESLVWLLPYQEVQHAGIRFG